MQGLEMVLVSYVAGTVCAMFKVWFRVPRPFWISQRISVFNKVRETTWSTPSNHACGAAALATMNAYQSVRYNGISSIAAG